MTAGGERPRPERAFDSETEAALARLAGDRDRGAAELAGDALQLMARAAAAAARRGEDAAALARALGSRIAALRPSMAPLANWAAAFAAEVEGALAGAGERDAKADACLQLGARLAVRKQGFEDAIVAAARPVLAEARAIVTISRSSTVEAALARAARQDATVWVCESRPRLEGRRLCAAIEAAGRAVRCVTDAEMAVALASADAALIGADAILGDLSVVNKVGSLALALCARHLGKPFYVVADSFKAEPARTRASAVFEAMDGAEVWPERPELCANVYFEAVPGALVSLYLTETGPCSADDMAKRIEEIANIRRAAGAAT